MLRAIKALGRADIALLLIDAEAGITAQDTHIAGMLIEENSGVIILVNKWDAVVKDSFTIYDYEKELREALKFIPYAPILFISAKTGKRVDKILPKALEVEEIRHQRIPTSELNKWMRDAITQHPPPSKGGKRVKFFYTTQVTTAPPTFVMFVNKPEWVHFSYQRFLENRLREAYPFEGSPMRLIFRARSEDRFGN